MLGGRGSYGIMTKTYSVLSEVKSKANDGSMTPIRYVAFKRIL